MNGYQIVRLTIGIGVVILVGLLVMKRRRGSSTFSINPTTGEFSHKLGQEPAGTTIKNAETSSGGVIAMDNTGAGVELDGIKAKKDIVATNNQPIPPPNR